MLSPLMMFEGLAAFVALGALCAIYLAMKD